MNLRIGNGIDFHKLVAGNDLLLGGIKINSPVGTVAYSDGDILIHVLVDSILGALSLGDLGTYFSSENPKWKNANSSTFLNFSLEEMDKLGYRILNTDLTIILQSPPLRQYNNEIRQNLSSMLSIDINQISLKATTTDKLGFIGQKKGISALATTLLIYGNYFCPPYPECIKYIGKQTCEN